MSKYDSMTEEQWLVAWDEFDAKYGAPRVRALPVLNLIMRREFAEAIVRGEKKVEIRSFSDHYFNRLTDKVVDKWMSDHRNDKGMDHEAFDEFMCSTRPVDRIHFHNYNNTWHLDVTVTENALIALTEDNLDDLRERFGFTDLDEMLDKVRREEAKAGDSVIARPLFYYFVVGEVLDTDLKPDGGKK